MQIKTYLYKINAISPFCQRLGNDFEKNFFFFHPFREEILSPGGILKENRRNFSPLHLKSSIGMSGMSFFQF